MIRTVGELKASIAAFPDDAELFPQVVGTDSGAWNMKLKIADAKASGWQEPGVIVYMTHPKLLDLPYSFNGDVRSRSELTLPKFSLPKLTVRTWLEIAITFGMVAVFVAMGCVVYSMKAGR